MGKKCVVCGTIQKSNSPLSFHRFPKNEGMCSAWKKACGVDHDTKNAVVCSKHFRVDDFDDTIWPLRKLHKTAIPAPTLRPKTAAIVGAGRPSKVKKVQNLASPGPSNTGRISQVVSSPEMKPCAEDTTPPHKTDTVHCYVDDLKPEDFDTPQKAEKHLDMVKKYFKRQRRKIEKLATQKMILETRIQNARDLIENM